MSSSWASTSFSPSWDYEPPVAPSGSAWSWPRSGPGTWPPSWAGSPVFNLAFALLLAAMAFFSLPWFKPALPLPQVKAGLVSAETPVEATRFLLQERPPGPLFHALSFGSYLIWAAQPDDPVFIDSRFELYSSEVVSDYLLASNAIDWEARLERYGVRILMLSPAEQPQLVEAVASSRGWQEIYRDPAALIFVKR